MPVVGVLMSTYNGEKFIGEQLESIICQKDVTVKLFIRDDGSTDRTREIIDSYKSKIEIQILEGNENVGPGLSFIKLLYAYSDEPEIDYYAFADQDDIWLEDKLASAIRMIDSCGYFGPVLYCSNQTIYKGNQIVGERYDTPQSLSPVSHLFRNTISGCTFVFNKALAHLISNSYHADYISKYRMHDAWVILVAILCGQVIYDEKSHILYRIHDNNTVGIKTVPLHAKLLKFLPRLFIKSEGSNIPMISAQQLLFFPNIKEEDRQTLELLANYQRSIKDKFALLGSKKIICESGKNPVVFIIEVLLNYI